MKTVIVTSATGEPLTLREVKEHLRIEVGETAEDDLLNGLIISARQRVETITNRKLMPQKWDYRLDEWPDEDCIELPFSPVQNIGSTWVAYKNSTGQIQTLSSTKWEVDNISGPGRLCLLYSEDWPSDTLWNVNPVSIRFTCGYSTSSTGAAEEAVPAAIKGTMLKLIEEMYNNRGTIEATPSAVMSALAPYRIWKF